LGKKKRILVSSRGRITSTERREKKSFLNRGGKKRGRGFPQAKRTSETLGEEKNLCDDGGHVPPREGRERRPSLMSKGIL